MEIEGVKVLPKTVDVAGSHREHQVSLLGGTGHQLGQVLEAFSHMDRKMGHQLLESMGQGFTGDASIGASPAL